MWTVWHSPKFKSHDFTRLVPNITCFISVYYQFSCPSFVPIGLAILWLVLELVSLEKVFVSWWNLQAFTAIQFLIAYTMQRQKGSCYMWWCDVMLGRQTGQCLSKDLEGLSFWHTPVLEEIKTWSWRRPENESVHFVCSIHFHPSLLPRPCFSIYRCPGSKTMPFAIHFLRLL